MGSVAIAVWPDGVRAQYPSVGFHLLEHWLRDDIANGDQPEGTRIFRLPRTQTINRYGRIERRCRACALPESYHEGRSFPCRRPR